jgi:hypothetical protein
MSSTSQQGQQLRSQLMDYSALLGDGDEAEDSDDRNSPSRQQQKRVFLSVALRLLGVVELGALLALWFDRWSFDFSELWTNDTLHYDPQTTGLDLMIVVAAKCLTLLFHCTTHNHIVGIRAFA